MWFEDLTECDYFSNILKMKPIAVGWLEKGKPYSTGKSPEIFTEKLFGLVKNKGITNASLGVHECDLCDVELPPERLNIIEGLGSRTTFVAHKNKLYIFPDLITHYINSHSYLPPAEFIEAALDSTPQDTIEYLKEIIQKRSSQE